MSITQTTEKRRLVIDLGAHEAPTAWRWEGVRFLRDENGDDAAPPQNVQWAATSEEAAAHIGSAMAAQAADLTEKGQIIAQRDARIAELTSALAKAHEALNAVVLADTSWDDAVRVKVTAALA